MLKEVQILQQKTLFEPLFIKPVEVTYTREDSDEIYWEMIKSHDSVHVFVNNVDTQEILFVNQVRIPVLVNNPETDGAVIECCAGIIDKPVLPAEIAIDEVREELGYDIDVLSVEHIKTLKSSVGTAGSTATTFYVEVSEDQYIGQQLSLFEDIEIVKVPYAEVGAYLDGATTDAITMFLTQWWIANRQDEIV